MEELKEADFEKYCKICKYFNLNEYQEPCAFCLYEPGLEGTHKPQQFQEDEARKKLYAK